MPDTALMTLEASWLVRLTDEFKQPYMLKLQDFLSAERIAHSVFPPHADLFNAFSTTPFDAVKVVVLGQDPYHGHEQAHGLSFSVRRGTPTPPSLRNIYRELNQDLGVAIPDHGDLTGWARQGVLLLNTVLTVRAHEANSHRKQGWERFTDRIITLLNEERDNLIFVLWGAAAGKKAEMIDARKHLILRSPHPSPLSAHRGFFGCGHFSAINRHLADYDLGAIDWRLAPEDGN